MRRLIAPSHPHIIIRPHQREAARLQQHVFELNLQQDAYVHKRERRMQQHAAA
jgi:hypothetical protein